MIKQRKVVIIGDTNVGKTSILNRYVHNTFQPNMPATCNSVFKSKEVVVNGDGDKVKLNIWDTAGQERYDALSKIYYKNAEAALIVYDITEKLTFEKA